MRGRGVSGIGACWRLHERNERSSYRKNKLLTIRTLPRNVSCSANAPQIFTSSSVSCPPLPCAPTHRQAPSAALPGDVPVLPRVFPSIAVRHPRRSPTGHDSGLDGLVPRHSGTSFRGCPGPDASRRHGGALLCQCPARDGVASRDPRGSPASGLQWSS